jgi:hypothetical protein
LHLRRGHIMLIAGGVIAMASFAAFVYLITDNTYSIAPNDRLVLRQFVSNASQGVYSISFPLFEGRPNLTILDTANKTVVEKDIAPPVVNEFFTTAESGYHTLIISNPSSDTVLEASILFGDRQSYIAQTVFSLLLYGGITTALAGAVITILDRRRISRMKEFGDTSDLV